MVGPETAQADPDGEQKEVEQLMPTQVMTTIVGALVYLGLQIAAFQLVSGLHATGILWRF